MNLLFPDDGLVYQMQQILTAQVKYHLFVNNYTPTLGDTIASFTEATWTGYTIPTVAWSDFAINGVTGHNGYAIAPPVFFANSSGADQSAYGYFVTDLAISKLIAVARFDSPPVVVPSGQALPVVPVWGDFSQFSTP